MKNSEVSSLLFTAALISGILISVNLNISRDKSMSLDEYQKYYEDRFRILSDINVIKADNKKLNEKIEKYTQRDEINKELENNLNLIGINDIEGEGIIIKLEDGDVNQFEASDSFIMRQKTIHDNDINEVLNELKAAGAQAISINDRRLTINSYVQCGGQFLKIDDVKEPAPFVIKVVGNPKKILARINDGTSKFKSLENRGIKIEKNISDNVKIPKYHRDVNFDKIEKN
ncbi:MAG: DUF881 domain-containing protein [Sarcina sp.]